MLAYVSCRGYVGILSRAQLSRLRIKVAPRMKYVREQRILFVLDGIME
ncbi:MAG: hypothetical protein IJF17_09705 [Thermoguttaceae bacterium]|nr:hypothetical protein [Thermoguttaceae bacterium]